MILYRLLLTLAAPVLAGVYAWRIVAGQTIWADLAERLGRPSAGPALWIHGASVGELNAGRPLIEAILARNPALLVVLTCNTLTGRAIARGWGLNRLTVQLAPLDYRVCLRRFLRGWKPTGLVILENELWPNRLMLASGICPVVMIGARLSARSHGRWAKAAPLAHRLLSRINLMSAQDTDSEQRLVSLGIASERVAPALVLKALVQLPDPDPEMLAGLQAIWPRDKTLLAASTHAGEEALILEAFQIARGQIPDLRLILAPRHPKRSEEVAALIASTGLPFAIRSKGTEPGPGTVVYLADTLGEMGLWYRLAGRTFVGGSLVDKGGHTPFEPAALGSAILHGPYLSNFADEYAALAACGGARQISDADELTRAMVDIDATEMAQMDQRARAALGTGDRHDLDLLIDRLAELPGLSNLARSQTGGSDVHQN
ncbi:MAG: 3-deoxy-D-manno-octulosonic acid transferase [Pseudomonadota bacterium]